MPNLSHRPRHVRFAVLKYGILAGLQVACAANPFNTPSIVAQQAITGRVWDAGTGLPLAGAMVSVLGTDVQSMTDGEGRYELAAPPGQRNIRAVRSNYRPQTLPVSTVPGQTITIDFTLFAVSTVDAVLAPAPARDTVPTARLRFSVPDSARVRYRQLTFRSFAPVVGGTAEFVLFDDVFITARADAVVPLGAGTFRWVGRLQDPLRGPHDNVVFVVRGGQLTGNVRFDGRVFQILPHEGALHIVLEVNPAKLPRELPPLPPLPPPPPIPQPPFPHPFLPELPQMYRPPPWLNPFGLAWPLDPPACTDLRNLMAAGPHELRLMVLYTDRVLATSPTVLDEIDLMIEYTNQAFANVGIPLRAMLAHATPITDPGDNGTTSASQYLDRLENPADPTFGVLHEWRDRYHVDVTVLIVEDILDAGGQARTMEIITVEFEKSAFAVVEHGNAVNKLSFGHELGHVIGGRHQRVTGIPETRPYRYGHGHVLSSIRKFTMMAIDPGATPAHERVVSYSNPDMAYDGVPLGVVSTDPAAADHRRAFTNTAAVVAAFRLTPVWFVSVTGTSPWWEKRVSGDPVATVRFGDFDGDGETDAFRVNADANTWEWSRSASEPWQTLRTLTGPVLPITELAFGDFDNDPKTDVFRSDVAAQTWLWSPGGTSAWQTLQPADPALALPVSQLAFADFDGIGGTDVLRTNTLTGEWFISSRGTGAWQRLNGPDPSFAKPMAELRFADLNGDGKADVIMTNPIERKWYWSDGGTSVWAVLRTNEPGTVNDFAPGDFNGDGKADAFKADGTKWLVSDGATEPWRVLRESCHLLGSLVFGDFDGDGATDVLRAGIRP